MLYATRRLLNRAYLDYIQLLELEDHSGVFGCVCGSTDGPRRVILDGNSLSYRAASAYLVKPWDAAPGDPEVCTLRRRERHPISSITVE